MSKDFQGCFTPRRELGRTDFMATQLGIGDLADRGVSIEDCVNTVRRAMDAGLNLIDTAPSYENGYSEEIVGRALKGRRAGMFVIDKIDFHDQPVAPQLEQSLKRLEIDTVDLFVLHGLSTLDGWQKAMAPSGSMEQLEVCRAQGKLRFRGISSHHPDVLIQAIESGLCDVVMFPVGACCDLRYIDQVLPLTKTRGVGSVCFKAFGAGKLLADTSGYNQPLKQRPRGKMSSGGQQETNTEGPRLPHMSVTDCLGYTLTCDPDVTLLGLSFPNEQVSSFRAALKFQPFDMGRMKQLRKEAALALQDKGPNWWNP